MKDFSNEWIDFLKKLFLDINIELTDTQALQFQLYAKELVFWNKKKNLTSITHPKEIAVLHFADSGFVLPFIKNQDKKIIDFGTGGGFPGVVLKILCPELDIHLLDSSGKKISFLKFITRELGFNDVKCINQRGEIFSSENKNLFGYAVSRAFTALDLFYEMILPCLEKKGHCLAMKGPGTEKEINDFKNKSYIYNDAKFLGRDVLMDIHEYRLPVLDHERKIISLTHSVIVK
ncbi:MAG: 16S rRNA (guanine(527)-N(7))-methyltransferase RsmG [Desulforegulaceae bacterium]|nr:16S rRNA (guanine(527)-N(7))-methyltransferase RsmG [Desulforegulaceae bacterium]